MNQDSQPIRLRSFDAGRPCPLCSAESAWYSRSTPIEAKIEETFDLQRVRCKVCLHRFWGWGPEPGRLGRLARRLPAVPAWFRRIDEWIDEYARRIDTYLGDPKGDRAKGIEAGEPSEFAGPAARPRE